jgi:hypothetical protein
MHRGTPIEFFLSPPKKWICHRMSNSIGKGNCETKTQLLTVYQDATYVYAKAVAALTRNIGNISRTEYEQLHVASEKARLTAHEARGNLDTQPLEHGC